MTGGSQRIGRAISIALAACGARVAVHFHQSRQAAQALCAELGPCAVPLAADLRDPAAAAALVAAARSPWDGLDILINNAAVFRPDTLSHLDLPAALEQMQINCWAPVALMQAFAAPGGPGQVVNLLDRHVAGLDLANASYWASKKLLAEFTRMAALEWAPRIRVNGVAPGAILRPSDRPGVPAGPVPLQRQCTPEEVAAAVVFLLNNEAVTGQILYVDGGQHLLA